MFKKVVLACFAAYFIGYAIGWFFWNPPTPEYPEDFMIYQSFITDATNYRHTMLNVIVLVQEYDVDEMCDEVRSFHDRMNGEPDKLDIRLFDSKEDFTDWNCRAERTFYKEPPGEE